VLLLLEKRRFLYQEDVTDLLRGLDRLCRKITNFQRSLRE
jgi:hypothetical protein